VHSSTPRAFFGKSRLASEWHFVESLSLVLLLEPYTTVSKLLCTCLANPTH
jgi:hypothetical protein